MRRVLKISAVVIVLLAIYVATFSYWWVRSPAKLMTAKNGRKVRVVEFQYNAVLWHTYLLWIPAFWFVESFCGYEAGGFAAMEEHSVQRYAKTLP